MLWKHSILGTYSGIQ